MSLEKYKVAFRGLRVHRRGGRFSPHKPCMLLAVIELFETGKCTANAIHFDDVLLSRYAGYFRIVATQRDQLDSWKPFFYLRSGGFWQHVPLSGRQQMLAAMSMASQKSHIRGNIAHARLDDELYALLSNTHSRRVLRETLITHWFAKQAKSLRAHVKISTYEEALADGQILSRVAESLPQRGGAFRRLVQEAYDFRCAASGWRIVLPDCTALVQAAHIVPFSETHDNRPQNGIALTPTFHWAMDRNIIAPGPDLKWHVSKTLDARIADYEPLMKLDDKPLLLPKDPKLYPDKDALERRFNQLRRGVRHDLSK